MNVDTPYGWDNEWFERMMNKDWKEKLIIAGALIASELDRLDFKDRLKNGK